MPDAFLVTNPNSAEGLAFGASIQSQGQVLIQQYNDYLYYSYFQYLKDKIYHPGALGFQTILFG